ncbi:MAG: capsule assembly Wzi family protein [Bacteroidota bacterium]
MPSIYKGYLLAIILSLAPILGIAQSDSLAFQVSTLGGVSSQPYLPQWLVANRFGILDYDNDRVGLIRAGASSYFQLGKHLRLGAALDGIARTSFSGSGNTVFLQQGYVKLSYRMFEVTAGQVERTLGNQAPDISSGSLSISGNARPIPQLLIAVPEYTAVPFTKGYLEFKGTFAHGWFGEDRYVESPLLHEKSLYVKAGGKFKINLSAGLVHLVTWGGRLPDGSQLPVGIDNYINVIFAQSAVNIDSSNNFQIGEAANAVGDNFGVYDFGLHIKLKDINIDMYHQTPFEDWTGSRLARNRDRLLGINLTSKREKHWLQAVVYEFLHTKYQSGPTLPGGPNDAPGARDRYGNEFGGRDNYYNNYLYRTGWSHQDHIIGTPLFYTKSRMRLYDPTFVDPDEGGFNFNIVNNRVVAHHFGITGSYKGHWRYKLLATFSRNYGTYGGINGGINRWGSIEDPNVPYAFRPPKNQQYFLTEIERKTPSGFTFYINVGIDTGEIYQTSGILTGLRWETHLLLSRNE